MKRRRLTIAVLLLTSLLLLGLVHLTSAAIRDGLTFVVDCGGFTSQGGSLILDRDNTGANRESIVISAVDGAGNVIFEPMADSFLVGGHLSLPLGTYLSWTSKPAANPLTVTIVSEAGNGLVAQPIYEVSGLCPTFIESAVATVLPSDGMTSDSVPLNTYPPSAENPVDVILTQPGYLIVNVELLNIRSGDSAGYTLVGIVEGGKNLIVLGRNANTTWWYVQIGTLRGWVNNEHVYVRGDLTDVPVVRPVGELIQPTFVPYTDSPLLAAPRSSALTLCVIPRDLEYRIAEPPPEVTIRLRLPVTKQRLPDGSRRKAAPFATRPNCLLR